MRMLAFLPALLAAFTFTACGGSRSPEPPAAATGTALSIEEALASDLSGPLLVKGYLLADGSQVRLCEALAESHPPRCGGPSLEVIGSKLLEQRRLYKTSGAVTWSEKPVRILGVVGDGTITVSENAGA